ncbi:beta-lactamase family protein [Candidatus Gracilibacteria bacterium]|nr:beta-lactamase family protein [Candidatus Gracilibacteria bacterium]
MLCSQLASARPAQAAAGISLAFFDPNSTGWFSVRNMTGADHQAFFDSTAAQGYIMIDAERHEIGDQLRHSSVWQRNTDGRGWASRSNLTSAEFSDYWDEYTKAGMRLIDQDTFEVDGELRYGGIWMENVENLGWFSYRNQTSAEFSEQFTAKSRDGFMLVDVEAYQIDGQQRYSQIWVENKNNLDWIERRDMTSQQYADYFDEYAARGMRVLDLESYRVGSQQRYAAIWVANTSGRGWYAYRDMTAQQYGNRWFELRDAGYRLTDFEIYETANGTRYAGVWRQNNARPNWGLKDGVNRLGEAYIANNDLAGLSIAVAQQGKFVYLRGFGHADIALNREFHSGTIARLASSSKAVAGVLALELEEKGLIDIDAQTRDYAPSLPNHHSHLVWHTIGNRSGVRHYGDDPDPTKNVATQYDTALEAAELFEDDPLNFVPGTGYGYSTHAYTMLGAAMEGAVGDPLATIVDEHLSDAYNIPTLQAEDRSQSNALRATLYKGTDSGPEPVVPDNISWKILGGGLEVSGADFARLGMKLMDGTILSEDSRERMWTPTTNASDFALGWNTGVDQGTQVVARVGAQTGGRSYIRMYPEHEIVIVILSNQRGHEPVDLGRAIGTLMLNEINSAANAETQQTIVAPPQPEEEVVEPAAEFGVPSLGVPLPSLLPPTATDDPTEPDGENAIGGQQPDPDPSPEIKLYLPLVRR